jgi:hypothetical protein
MRVRSRIADKASSERELFSANRLYLFSGFLGGQDLDGDEAIVSTIFVASAVLVVIGLLTLTFGLVPARPYYKIPHQASLRYDTAAFSALDQL